MNNCLLQKLAPPGSSVVVDVYDAVGIGAGGSGAAAGLLHPFTPRGKVGVCQALHRVMLHVLPHVITCHIIWLSAVDLTTGFLLSCELHTPYLITSSGLQTDHGCLNAYGMYHAVDVSAGGSGAAGGPLNPSHPEAT